MGAKSKNSSLVFTASSYNGDMWMDSSIEKFHSINTNNNTCKKMLKCFNNKWKAYKPYNGQFPNWEYMCLLKLVWNGKLDVNVDGKVLTFKRLSD